MNHRIFLNLSDAEFAALETLSEKMGLSISATAAYAISVYLNMPRTQTTSLSQIAATISSFISSKQPGTTFICSSPFANTWGQMTTSDKRTAASQLKILERNGKIKKLPAATKAHVASTYMVI